MIMDSSSRCIFCAGFPENNEKHLSTRTHTSNFLKYYISTEENKNALVSDKYGVTVSCVGILECIPVLKLCTAPRKPVHITFNIENSGSTIIFVQCEFLHSFPCRCTLFDEHGVTNDRKSIRMLEGVKMNYYVQLEIQPNFVGTYTGPLVFHFVTDENKKPFYIIRFIEVNCNDVVAKELQDTAEPFDPQGLQIISRPARTILSAPFEKIHDKPKLKKIPVAIKHSPDLITTLKWMQRQYISQTEEFRSDVYKNALAESVLSVLNHGLTGSTYREYFSLLLMLEEIQMDLDIRKYDMSDVTLSKFGPHGCNEFRLHVPGLAENRPSVMLGDSIYIRIVAEKKLMKTNPKMDIEYEGRVCSVSESSVGLKFNAKFYSKFIEKMKLDVRFSYNKLPLNTIHNALSNVTQDQIATFFFPGEKTLFAVERNGIIPDRPPVINMAPNVNSVTVLPSSCPPLFETNSNLLFCNRDIDQNPEQASAVKHIVAGSSLPAPYLVHGPPGTGKTVTIVEAIKQIHKKYPESFILVCTPSNSAADLIAEKLLDHISKKDIFRYYSASREEKKIPESLKNAGCCNFDFHEHRPLFPELKIIETYRIVVCTLVHSGRLISMGVEKNHFTHLFIDEAGHSIEAEILIPVSGLLEPRVPGQSGFGGQLVLSGDPMQLGPVIRCKVAQLFGLNISFLERLMTKSRIYQKNEGGRFNPKVLTRLLRNYRSHPAILELPNKMFYDGELQYFADKLEREALCQWEGLPSPEFPVLFHGVLGRDLREGKSPSYFNAQEVSTVITCVQDLLAARKGGIKIEQRHIGVISPYRQQVYKIKQELLKKNLRTISVGSVDEFQGQERRVIIISTVRSDPNLMNYDSQYKIGFVRNPKRFNVAITRAKALLIVIGNPNLLQLDHHWNQLLRYCREEHFSYIGVNYELPENAELDLIDRFRQLGLLPSPNNSIVIEISPRAQQEDPQWRDEF